MATFVLNEIVRQTDRHICEAVDDTLDGDAGKAFAALDAGGGSAVEQPDTSTHQAVLARDSAALTREEREKTLVLDPTREGRRHLTACIRAALVRDGALGEEALVATILELRGLTRAEAKRAASYVLGDVVTSREQEKDRPRPGTGYRVESVDSRTGTVRLLPARGKAHDWQPARWGASHAEAFAEVEMEVRAGDRLQFTRNNYRAGRLNGHTAKVITIGAAGSGVVVAREGGRHEMLDMAHLADRHVRHGWVRTIHSTQSATTDRVMTNCHIRPAGGATARLSAPSTSCPRRRDGCHSQADIPASRSLRKALYYLTFRP